MAWTARQLVDMNKTIHAVKGCFSPRTMTLNLPEAEMLIVEALARKKGITKTALLKQALRLYHYVDKQRNNGKRLLIDDDLELELIL